MTKQRTCAERVNEEWANERDVLGFWMENGTDAERPDEGYGPFWEYGLCFDYVEPGTFEDQPEGYFRYQISWGGPSDEIRFYADLSRDGWQLYRAEYWFLDWWDGASVNVTKDDVAIWLFDLMNELGMISAAHDAMLSA